MEKAISAGSETPAQLAKMLLGGFEVVTTLFEATPVLGGIGKVVNKGLQGIKKIESKMIDFKSVLGRFIHALKYASEVQKIIKQMPQGNQKKIQHELELLEGILEKFNAAIEAAGSKKKYIFNTIWDSGSAMYGKFHIFKKRKKCQPRRIVPVLQSTHHSRTP